MNRFISVAHINYDMLNWPWHLTWPFQKKDNNEHVNQHNIGSLVPVIATKAISTTTAKQMTYSGLTLTCELNSTPLEPKSWVGLV